MPVVPHDKGAILCGGVAFASFRELADNSLEDCLFQRCEATTGGLRRESDKA